MWYKLARREPKVSVTSSSAISLHLSTSKTVLKNTIYFVAEFCSMEFQQLTKMVAYGRLVRI